MSGRPGYRSLMLEIDRGQQPLYTLGSPRRNSRHPSMPIMWGHPGRGLRVRPAGIVAAFAGGCASCRMRHRSRSAPVGMRAVWSPVGRRIPTATRHSPSADDRRQPRLDSGGGAGHHASPDGIRRMTTRLALGAVLIVGCLLSAPGAAAQPYPGCPFIRGVPLGVCSNSPGVPGFTPGFTLTPGVPGTWGPDGIYTPVKGDSHRTNRFHTDPNSRPAR